MERVCLLTWLACSVARYMTGPQEFSCIHSLTHLAPAVYPCTYFTLLLKSKPTYCLGLSLNIAVHGLGLWAARVHEFIDESLWCLKAAIQATTLSLALVCLWISIYQRTYSLQSQPCQSLSIESCLAQMDTLAVIRNLFPSLKSSFSIYSLVNHHHRSHQHLRTWILVMFALNWMSQGRFRENDLWRTR